MTALKTLTRRVSPEHVFMGSVLLVNGGNYLYNLILGRLLGPAAFADAALLVTLLLVLSFVGMTFQLATAKFAVLFSEDQWEGFQCRMYKAALVLGLIAGSLLIFFATELQQIFNTQSNWMFTAFGVGIPLYFFMSVNRGRFQGQQQYGKLSLTYQMEMWSRLAITMLLLWILPFEPGILIALGIAFSFVFGLVPVERKAIPLRSRIRLSADNKKRVRNFIVLTAAYELTQILINNSDVLLVKHYFEPLEAGLYASLALIGRVVYFAAWMFVMLLLPKVVAREKAGEPTAPVLFKYVSYIGLITVLIVSGCYLFPELVIELLFGKAYLSMAPLLWQYALATSLFAIANIFAYYFLSLDQYVPVILSGLIGLSQILLVIFFHSSLQMVVQVQIVAMLALLVTQLIYFTQDQIRP
ncbi:MATE family efflux transporter [Poritiphilus flavus]|uniref:Sugar isomerase n=1 Tax=Poritiphilus flavus TaxID=2697053 RepID=A0A6L9E6V0_9FLAO|nr:sugar isomerase [Poritiphilus flavus]NAS10436.1 sugar isomerase [Poritiphilus flavus]